MDGSSRSTGAAGNTVIRYAADFGRPYLAF